SRTERRRPLRGGPHVRRAKADRTGHAPAPARPPRPPRQQMGASGERTARNTEGKLRRQTTETQRHRENTEGVRRCDPKNTACLVFFSVHSSVPLCLCGLSLLAPTPTSKPPTRSVESSPNRRTSS